MILLTTEQSREEKRQYWLQQGGSIPFSLEQAYADIDTLLAEVKKNAQLIKEAETILRQVVDSGCCQLCNEPIKRWLDKSQ